MPESSSSPRVLAACRVVRAHMNKLPYDSPERKRLFEEGMRLIYGTDDWRAKHAEAMAALEPVLLGWQPMDTAPKDKTFILAKDANGDISIVQWDREHIYSKHPSWVIKDTYDGDIGIQMVFRAPTGWMPLPSP